MPGVNYLDNNIKILLRLNNGNVTLDELAEHLKLPSGFLSIPLGILQKQGLIENHNGSYSLNSKSDELGNVLNLIIPWLDYQDNTYYEIAKDIARVIHTKSWDEVGVKDVLLFGSTVRKKEVPNDIDLLILHDGYKLEEFYDDAYEEHSPKAVCLSDHRVGDNSRRIWATGMLNLLGYKGNDALLRDKLYHERFGLESQFREDSAYNNVMNRVKHITGEDDSAALDKLLDIHAMSVNLLIRDEDEGRFRYYSDKRTQAINCCRDPTFWYTVLSEGRIYDLDKHDFTIKVNDKYPDAIRMFQRN